MQLLKKNLKVNNFSKSEQIFEIEKYSNNFRIQFKSEKIFQIYEFISKILQGVGFNFVPKNCFF